MANTRTAIGLMSGTSLDGIDAAVLTTDGEGLVNPGPEVFLPYDEAIVSRIESVIASAAILDRHEGRPALFDEAEGELTEWNKRAVGLLLEKSGLRPGDVDLVGYHGQTVLHNPERGLSIQLGDGSRLARAIGIDVVSDFRGRDVAAGGQGAPLVPIYHKAVLAQRAELPAVIVNIGGVANVTWIDQDGSLLAFDTGPGNALIDDWIRAHTKHSFDRDGAAGLAGTIDAQSLEAFLDTPFFALPPPKSLDRNTFRADAVQQLNLEDGAATLAAFTAHSIALAQRHFPASPGTWVICGGGRKNAAIVTTLRKQVSGPVAMAEDVGLNGDFIEAQAFAYLAVRSVRNLPITFPGTTGVALAISGGTFQSKNR